MVDKKIILTKNGKYLSVSVNGVKMASYSYTTKRMYGATKYFPLLVSKIKKVDCYHEFVGKDNEKLDRCKYCGAEK